MAFTCPLCGKTSHNPNDEANRYCGNCHAFITTQHYQCPVCQEIVSIDVVLGMMTPTELPAALTGLAGATEERLHDHLRGHGPVEVLQRIRALQTEIDKLRHEATRELTLVVEAAGGAVTVPNRLRELVDDSWSLVRWDDPADNVVRFRVNREVSSERT